MIKRLREQGVLLFAVGLLFLVAFLALLVLASVGMATLLALVAPRLFVWLGLWVVLVAMALGGVLVSALFHVDRRRWHAVEKFVHWSKWGSADAPPKPSGRGRFEEQMLVLRFLFGLGPILAIIGAIVEGVDGLPEFAVCAAWGLLGVVAFLCCATIVVDRRGISVRRWGRRYGLLWDEVLRVEMDRTRYRLAFHAAKGTLPLPGPRLWGNVYNKEMEAVMKEELARHGTPIKKTDAVIFRFRKDCRWE